MTDTKALAARLRELWSEASNERNAPIDRIAAHGAMTELLCNSVPAILDAMERLNDVSGSLTELAENAEVEGYSFNDILREVQAIAKIAAITPQTAGGEKQT